MDTLATGQTSGPSRPLGSPPRWRILYKRMATLQGGELLTYEQMAELLGLDLGNLSHYQSTLASARKAADALKRDGQKVFRLVRGQGYEVAEAGQAIEVAQRHQARAVSEIHAGHATIETIDRNQLDVTTARLVEAMAIGFGRQHSMMRHLDVRQDRLETTIAALTETTHGTASRIEQTAASVNATQADLTRLRQRVAELEANTSGHQIPQYPGGQVPRASFLPPAIGS